MGSSRRESWSCRAALTIRTRPSGAPAPAGVRRRPSLHLHVALARRRHRGNATPAQSSSTATHCSNSSDPAPPPVRERAPPSAAHSARRRGTYAARCDARRPRHLSQLRSRRARSRGADFSAVLYRAFGARAVDDYAPGVQLLKKGVPSAGGLHPTEAYLLVQRVEGIAPGLYHYHPVDHALEPIRTCSPRSKRAALARRFVGAQPYFRRRAGLRDTRQSLSPQFLEVQKSREGLSRADPRRRPPVADDVSRRDGARARRFHHRRRQRGRHRRSFRPRSARGRPARGHRLRHPRRRAQRSRVRSAARSLEGEPNADAS